MSKIKLGWYWCASCGGCEESFLDISEKLLELEKKIEIVFCPVAFDFKIEDVKKLPDKSIDVTFINGGIRLEEHEHVVKLLRNKSKILISYGACAIGGGIPALLNLYDKEEVFRRIYLEVPTVNNPNKVFPKEVYKEKDIEIKLPKFLPYLKPVDKVVEVDYYIPGCPPTPEVFLKAMQELLSEKIPKKKSFLGALEKSLCDECPLNLTKPEKISINSFKRFYREKIDPSTCLLNQGFLCLGPVTRGGCGALCIKGNMPCTGCFGNLENVKDYGGKAISFLGSLLDIKEEENMEKVLNSLSDIVGIIYKYNFALYFKRKAKEK